MCLCLHLLSPPVTYISAIPFSREIFSYKTLTASYQNHCHLTIRQQTPKMKSILVNVKKRDVNVKIKRVICFQILSILVVVTHGRPEPPSGYNYPSPPSAKYGAPSGGQDQGSFRQSGAGFGGGFGSGSAGSFAGSFGSGSGFGGSFSSGQSSSSGAVSQSSSAQSGRSSSGDSSNGGASSDSIVVNKHIYVHVPPPELEEEPQQKAQIRVPPPQKNYKIIFIKAPAPAANPAPQIPPIPQNEEKTLVYVLVKKPEEQGDIQISTPAPTEPSRPEVYFIKYKTQKESGGQQGATEGEDDTVEVGAREGGAAQGGFSAGGLGGADAGQAGGRQGGALAGGYSYSSPVSSSGGVSRQYGAPNTSGPY